MNYRDELGSLASRIREEKLTVTKEFLPPKGFRSFFPRKFNLEIERIEAEIEEGSYDGVSYLRAPPYPFVVVVFVRLIRPFLSFVLNPLAERYQTTLLKTGFNPKDTMATATDKG